MAMLKEYSQEPAKDAKLRQFEWGFSKMPQNSKVTKIQTGKWILKSTSLVFPHNPISSYN